MKIKNKFVIYQHRIDINARVLTTTEDREPTYDDLYTVERNITTYFDYKLPNTVVEFDKDLYINFDNISNILYNESFLAKNSYSSYITVLINDISQPYTESFKECSKKHLFNIDKMLLNQLIRSFKLHQIKHLDL